MLSTGGVKSLLPPSHVIKMWQDTLMRETPKASTTTSCEKSDEGTRLIAVPNSNKVEDEI